MKIKFHFLTVLFLLFVPFAFGQSKKCIPLQDAVDYVDYVEEGEQADAKRILEKYFKEIPSSSRLMEVDPALQNSALVSSTPEIGEINSGTGSPLDASVMIDELGKLIADRFREELTLAFLDNFRKKLKADTLLGELFPNTKRVLLFDDPFNYESWLTSFRGAMHEDLHNIPENLEPLLQGIADLIEDRLPEKERGAVRPVLELCDAVGGIIRHPEQTYSNMLDALNAIEKSLRDSVSQEMVALLTPFLKELSVTYDDWAENDLLGRLSEPKVLKTYLAFTIQKHQEAYKKKKVDIGGKKTTLYDWAFEKNGNEDSRVAELVQFVKFLSKQVKGLNGVIAKLKNEKKNTPDNKLTYDDYAPLITASLDFLDKLADPRNFAFLDLDSVATKKVDVIADDIQTLVPLLEEINTAFSSKDYSGLLPAVLKAVNGIFPDSVLETNVFLKDFLKYGNLAVNLSSAQTSEEFANALESAVLPAQSYRLKRNSVFSVSVNAYAGAFFAAEYLEQPSVRNRISPLAGFTAPIGIGFNWGLTCNKPTKYSKYPVKTYVAKKGEYGVARAKYFSGHSFSIFASVIDVGAVAAFRLKDDESPAANVQWKNILSPGFQLIWGVGNTPLALSIGTQYGPELRSVEAKDGNTVPVIDSRAWRFGGGITVDIPLFNLYSSSERVKNEQSREKMEKVRKKANKALYPSK